ncbi:TetR/AcrR family transcriptional regulator [soil metagenome]
MSPQALSISPRWSRLDRDERREQILLCAHQLFESNNFSAVSTSEIAEAAGVTRGLLHHYFGTKRELYLEVVRQMVRLPELPLPIDAAGRTVEDVLDESVSMWLDRVYESRRTWLAAVGGEGLGRDPEVELILERARETVATQLLRVLGIEAKPESSPELFAVIRAFGAMAEGATAEWLRRGRLDREQVHTLLTRTLLAMVRDVFPEIAADGALEARFPAA